MRAHSTEVLSSLGICISRCAKPGRGSGVKPQEFNHTHTRQRQFLCVLLLMGTDIVTRPPALHTYVLWVTIFEFAGVVKSIEFVMDVT